MSNKKEKTTTITVTSDEKNTGLKAMASLAAQNVSAGFTVGDMTKADGKAVKWECK